jgi:hypothetical protein
MVNRSVRFLDVGGTLAANLNKPFRKLLPVRIITIVFQIHNAFVVP